MFGVKCISVLVALVSLSAPSISRSWGGQHDRFPQKSWVSNPYDDPRHQPNHGWGHDFDGSSSEEESWESNKDYHSQGYGYDKYDTFGYHHEPHNFDHHNHGDYDYHHRPGHKHYNSGGRNNNHDRSKPTSPPSSGFPQNNKGNNAFDVRLTPAHNTGLKPNPAAPQNTQNRGQFSKNYADRVVFPEESPSPKLTTTRSPPVSSSSSLPAPPPPPSRPLSQPAATQAPPTSTTISSLVLADIVRCIRDCPATPEFNPVCGTNNVTYNNLGALECTRNCGVNVALGRRAPCPQPLPPAYFISVAMQSTEQPIVNAPVGDVISNAPMPRSGLGLALRVPTTAPPAAEKPTRFTNIQSAQDSDLNIDGQTNP